MKMTHSELVARAARWLRVTMGARVVLTEFDGMVREIPDVIGFGPYDRSTLIECKSSRSDFFADQKKPERSGVIQGVGQFRWYFTPAGLLRRHEIPDGWGLAEVHGRIVKRIIDVNMSNTKHDADLRGERMLLISAVYRALESYQLLKPMRLGLNGIIEDADIDEEPDAEA